MAENVKTQKFTVRHFLVLFTCMICIFTSSAITFSCPGLAYRPVAMQLGIQVSDVSLLHVLCLLVRGYLLANRRCIA